MHPCWGRWGYQRAPHIRPQRIPEAESLDSAGERCPQERGCEVGAVAGKGALAPPLHGDSVCGMPTWAPSSLPASTCPDSELGSRLLSELGEGKRAGVLAVSLFLEMPDADQPNTPGQGSLLIHIDGRPLLYNLLQTPFSCLNKEKNRLCSLHDNFSSFILRDNCRQIWTHFTWGVYNVCALMPQGCHGTRK